MTLRLAPEKYPQRQRLTQAELHALDRKLAVFRLKDQLFPAMGKWRRLRRRVRHLIAVIWG